MPTTILEITPIGFEKASHDLYTVGDRLRNNRPAFVLITEFIEKSEERVFQKLRGKYVDTGALKESLTQATANDAIRIAHNDMLDFGSSLYYAKYQRDRRTRKSAVLKFLPKERHEASEAVLKLIMRDIGTEPV